MKCATLGDDLKRLRLAVVGRYHPHYEREADGSLAREDHDGYWAELGHAIKNVPVEFLRRIAWRTGWSWLNRKGKPQSECTHYRFPGQYANRRLR